MMDTLITITAKAIPIHPIFKDFSDIFQLPFQGDATNMLRYIPPIYLHQVS